MSVPGLTVIEDFITEEEEREIIAFQDGPSFQLTMLGRRLVTGAGFAESPEIVAVTARLVERRLLDSDPPAALMILHDYQAGQSMCPHVDDDRMGPRVAIVNFRSPAVMTFSRSHDHAPEVVIQFRRRALIHMAGPTRHDWLHGLLRFEARRGSMVFGNPRVVSAGSLGGYP